MRWATLCAASVAAACARPSAPAHPRDEPQLRVGVVVSAASVDLGGQGRVAGFSDGSARVQLGHGETVRLRPDGRAVAAGTDGSAGRYQALTFTTLDPGRHVTVNGRPYRGAVEVTVRDGRVTAVNILGLEDYLRGVVSAELGRRTPEERSAVEAQAIVSRTYALHNRGRFRSQGFDLQAGVSDQVYGGVAVESPEANAAVRATTGQALTWRGELIVPFFHSTCGFSTAAPEEAFRTIRGTPYLRPVSDRRGDGYYCDISPRFRWAVEWDGTVLRDILGRTVPRALGIPADEVSSVRNVYVRRTGPSGRAQEIRIATPGGEIPVFGPDVRQVFETPEGRMLGSAAVELEAKRQSGEVTRLVATGAGWGHGVGMCQWGAIGRARAGQSAEAILTTYFPGTTVARWY